MARRFSPLRTDDADLARVQDEIARVLNAKGAVPVYGSAARPAPGLSLAATFIRIHDAGSPERLQVCLQNSDGSWAWVDCALAAR